MFDQIYLDIIYHLRVEGIWQKNQRTGTLVLASHGYSFKWPMSNAPLSTLRPMYLKTMAAELAWMLSGEKSTAWLKQYTHIWDDFEVNGEVERAYGYRWRHAFGYDQIQHIISTLQRDPSSRQCVLMSWDPREDGVKPAKNIPCPYTAVVNIIAGKLNIHLTLRSNDVLYGLPYDVGMYTLLGHALAESLGVEVGTLFYSIAHLHLYENQMKAAAALLEHRGLVQQSKFVFNPKFTYWDILEHKDEYVDAITKLQRDMNYNPNNVTKGLLPKVVL